MRWFVRFLVFLLILPLAYFATFPQIFRCQLLEYTGDFQRLTTGVWVDANTPERQRIYLLFEINEAKKRLEQLWNSPAKGRATVIFCQLPEQYQQYCHDGEGAGCSLAWNAVADIKAHMDRVCNLQLRHPDSMKNLISEHEAIIVAIDSKDSDASAAAMRRHLNGILSDLPQIEAQNPELFE